MIPIFHATYLRTAIAVRRGDQARWRLAELSAAKVTELQVPGHVLLKLAVKGLGVRLP